MNRAVLIAGPYLSFLIPVLGVMYFMIMWKYHRDKNLVGAIAIVALALALLFATLPASQAMIDTFLGGGGK